jgi:hypothetical protein
MRAHEIITELNMSPSNLLRFAQSPTAANMKAGFEAELCIPGVYSTDSNDEEVDLDEDRYFDHNLDWSDIRDFFMIGRNDGALSNMQDEYYDWQIKTPFSEYLDDHLHDRVEFLQHEDKELGGDDAKDQALKELEDEFWQDLDGNGASLYDFCKALNMRSYYNIFERYERRLSWPYYKYSTNDFESEVGDYSYSLGKVVGGTVRIQENPIKDKSLAYWYIESDSSITPHHDDYMGIEVVSPPMTVMEMLDKMEATFDWANANNAYANSSTGLHVGVSIDGLKTENIDYVKLALFLGDKYVLQQFGRLSNNFTRSSLDEINRILKHQTTESDTLTKLVNLKHGFVNQVSKGIQAKNTSKYFSINVHENYIEFRSMGGNDYLAKFVEIKNTVLRYVRAYAVAADPNAERNEYLKKLANMMNLSGNDDLIPFVQFAAGGLGAGEQSKRLLKQWLRTKANPIVPSLGEPGIVKPKQ